MEKLKAKLDRYNKAYVNKPLITDDEYEALLTKFNLLYGEYEPPVEHTALSLPIFAPSLRKIKLKKDLDKWEKDYRGSKIVTDKIDGISFIVSYGDTIKLYTHTNSETGFDKTHLLPHLNLPPIKIKDGEKMVVRGELAIRLDVFDKYKGTYTSPRNMIAGVINSKEVDKKILNDFSFLAFQLVYIYKDGTSSNMTSEMAFNLLKKYGFDIVTNITKVNEVTDEMLKERLKLNCPYLRDGLVVAQNEYEPLSKSDPKNKIAFKVLGDTEETTVINVEWNPSRLNKLKPRIHYDSVFLSNANLTWTSGFNARFITKHRIGVGTKILMTRSGDVNPYIVSVIEGTIASLPDYDYQWDDNKTEIYVEINDKIKIKRICHFFDVLGAKYLGEKTIAKLYANKYDTVDKILNIQLDHLLTIDGIKKLSAERIRHQITTITNNVTLVKVMEASGIFVGFGDSKLNNILTHLPDIVDHCLKDTSIHLSIEDIKKIDGIDKTAKYFIDYLSDFRTFLDEIKVIKDRLIEKQYGLALPVVTQTIGTMFNGFVIVFSGDKKLTERVKLLGGVVDKNVTKRTTLLVVDEVGSLNSKERMCVEKKIPIMGLKEFKLKYDL